MRHAVTIAALVLTVAVSACSTGAKEPGFTREDQDKWSARSEAQPLSVGDAPYECVSGSAEGNFGTLKMPRSTNDSAGADGWI